jgi:cyclophilin family peptidyl-prolyl cis-trans isomerase
VGELKKQRIAFVKRGPTLSLMLSVSFALLLFAACNDNAKKESGADDSDEASLAASVKRHVYPQPDAEVAVIETKEYGKITLELYPNIAPQMVARFKQLIKENFYDGTTFHRIDPDLGIIQGGDPLSKDDDPNNDGTGDSKYPNVPGEMSDVPFERGTLGAARKGAQTGMSEREARDTANCQFFITLKRQPAFDERYTVFGRVVEGLNNAETIMGAPVAEGTERPDPPIIIKSITLQKRQ